MMVKGRILSSNVTCLNLVSAFGSRVLKGGGEDIFNLKCLVQFLEWEWRVDEGSKFYYTAKIIL